MSLEASISTHAGNMRALAHELDGYLNALKALLPNDERTRHAFIDARRTVGFLHSGITQIETILAAGRATGQVEQPLAAVYLELHPKRLPAQVEHERLLASLHRVADHTQDPDENTDGETPHVVTYGGKDS